MVPARGCRTCRYAERDCHFSYLLILEEKLSKDNSDKAITGKPPEKPEPQQVRVIKGLTAGGAKDLDSKNDGSQE